MDMDANVSDAFSERKSMVACLQFSVQEALQELGSSNAEQAETFLGEILGRETVK